MNGRPDESKQKQNSFDTKENVEESILDKVVSGGIKRGLETLVREGRLKSILQDLKLPKEIVAHILSQVDDTKHAALGVIGREVRLFLERTNLPEELSKLLTSISFEVKTQVRFIPRDNPGKTQKKEKTRKTKAKAKPQKPTAEKPSVRSSE
jgi:hypothetical protein